MLSKVFLVLNIFLVFFLQASCTSSNFSRNEAKKIIYSSRNIKGLMTEIPLHDTGFKKGIEQDMWIKKGTLWDERVILTERGKKYFSDIKYKSYAVPVIPVDIEVQVTGITDAVSDGIKEAQFVWIYSGVPSVVKRFIIAGGIGRAYFRRYDDGWRMEEIEVKKENEAARLSDEEIKQEKEEAVSIQNDVKDRIRKEKEEKERIALLITNAKTPTKTIDTFIFHSKKEDLFKKEVSSKVTITDVDLRITIEEKSSGGMIGSTNEYWYGYIVDIDSVYNEDKKYYGLRIRFNRVDLSDKYAEVTIWNSSKENIYAAVEKAKNAVNKFKETHQEAIQMRFDR